VRRDRAHDEVAPTLLEPLLALPAEDGDERELLDLVEVADENPLLER